MLLPALPSQDAGDVPETGAGQGGLGLLGLLQVFRRVLVGQGTGFLGVEERLGRLRGAVRKLELVAAGGHAGLLPSPHCSPNVVPFTPRMLLQSLREKD